jgi:hypothetical protein
MWVDRKKYCCIPMLLMRELKNREKSNFPHIMQKV